MNKSEVKKEHILSCGIDVMKMHGYNGTSVKDIVDAAEVPKGSFYNYFESKKAFAIEAIEKTALENYSATKAILGNKSVPPIERLEQFFSASIENACENNFTVGCFLGNMCQEMSDNCNMIRSKIKSVMGKTTGFVEDVLKEAQEDGTLKHDSDPAMVAEFLFNAWEGALMRMKASKSREPLDAFLQVLPIICKE